MDCTELPELVSKETLRVQVLDGCSTRHVDNMVRDGRLPKPIYMLGRRMPRWRRCDLKAWLERLAEGQSGSPQNA